MNKKIWLFSYVIITALASTPSIAQNYVFEPVHTQILFFCDHLGFSKSQGEFLKFNGTFNFNPDNLEDTVAQISIEASSIDMDNDKWNDHMKNEDFFDVENYPTIEFKSTKVVSHSDKKATMHGDLTILGHTESVALSVTHNKLGVHPFSGETIAGFSATTTINRSLFGMTYGLPALGDEVEIRLEVEGVQVTK